MHYKTSSSSCTPSILNHPDIIQQLLDGSSVDFAVSDSLDTISREQSWILRNATFGELPNYSKWQVWANVFNCTTPTGTSWGNYEGNSIFE